MTDMTVEELIELLKEKYPQAIILVEEPFGYREAPRVLTPIGLQSMPRSGCVHIICKEYVGRRI